MVQLRWWGPLTHQTELPSTNHANQWMNSRPKDTVQILSLKTYDSFYVNLPKIVNHHNLSLIPSIWGPQVITWNNSSNSQWMHIGPSALAWQFGQYLTRSISSSLGFSIVWSIFKSLSTNTCLEVSNESRPVWIRYFRPLILRNLV